MPGAAPGAGQAPAGGKRGRCVDRRRRRNLCGRPVGAGRQRRAPRPGIGARHRCGRMGHGGQHLARGAAAAAPPAGHSLERLPGARGSAQDTDENASDFVEREMPAPQNPHPPPVPVGGGRRCQTSSASRRPDRHRRRHAAVTPIPTPTSRPHSTRPVARDQHRGGARDRRRDAGNHRGHGAGRFRLPTAAGSSPTGPGGLPSCSAVAPTIAERCCGSAERWTTATRSAPSAPMGRRHRLGAGTEPGPWLGDRTMSTRAARAC